MRYNLGRMQKGVERDVSANKWTWVRRSAPAVQRWYFTALQSAVVAARPVVINLAARAHDRSVIEAA